MPEFHKNKDFCEKILCGSVLNHHCQYTTAQEYKKKAKAVNLGFFERAKISY
jgi:hypothetical protein